jgi:putative endonuclease
MPASSRWSVYIVRCRGGALYTGIAIDVRRRLAQHAGARNGGARYLRGKTPLRLELTRVVGSRSRAQSIEYRINRQPRAGKLALIANRVLLARLIATSALTPFARRR